MATVGAKGTEAVTISSKVQRRRHRRKQRCTCMGRQRSSKAWFDLVIRIGWLKMSDNLMFCLVFILSYSVASCSTICCRYLWFHPAYVFFCSVNRFPISEIYYLNWINTWLVPYICFSTYIIPPIPCNALVRTNHQILKTTTYYPFYICKSWSTLKLKERLGWH
jgi:hypothetical protein